MTICLYRGAWLLAGTVALLSAFPAVAHAADLEGTIRDRATRQPVRGAVVTVVGPGQSVRVAEDGSWRLGGVPEGAWRVKVEAEGYVSWVSDPLPFRDDRPVVLKLRLRPGIVTVPGQRVAADRPSVLAQTQPSRRSFTAEDVRRIAGARNDAVLAVTNSAGVKTGGFGGNLVIRGGGPNDNRYFFDDVQIGNPFHLGGLLSVFNSNTIAKVDLYQGAIPARFPNVQSAVIDIETRRPAEDGVHAVLESNLLYSEGLIEGPIGGGVLLSAALRRSYIDLVIGRFFEEGQIFPYFTDRQFKLLAPIAGGGQVELTHLGSVDQARIKVPQTQDSTSSIDSFGLDTGFTATGLSWRQPLGDQVSNKLILNYQDPSTDFKLGRLVSVNESRYTFSVIDDLVWQIDAGRQLRTGVRYDTINYLSRRTQPDLSLLPRGQGGGPPGAGGGGASGNVAGVGRTADIERLPKVSSETAGNQKQYGLYFEDEWRPTETLTVAYGARAEHLNPPQDSSGQGIDTLGPRGGVTWRVDPDNTLRLSLGQQHQFPGVVRTLPTIGNPDLQNSWVNDHIVGWDRQINEFLLGRFEGYFRELRNLSDRNDPGVRPPFINSLSGRAYGLEGTLDLAPWEGWQGSLAVSLSRAFRTGRNGVEIPYDFDQPVTLNLTMAAPETWGWKPSLKFRYATGRPYTPVVDRRLNAFGEYDGIPSDQPNSARYPDGFIYAGRIERPAPTWGKKGSFYIEVQAQQEVVNVDYGKEFEKIGNPTFQYGLPAIPYLGYTMTW
ncbi:MAG: TonB-dependent receptor [Candidatus Sericytochromatia bacterium]|nr:TonB-dependent receptor [Candidatus Sericytochromatia bacterium]